MEQKFAKDRTVAGLLALFLGIFGIHKFYLGYSQAGLVMLAMTVLGPLTCGLTNTAVIAISIAETIVYLSSSDEHFQRVYVDGKRDWF